MTSNNGKSHANPSGIMARLKKETAERHAQLEALPYFKKLMEHRLPLECYVSQLRALSIIHGLLENELAISADKHVREVWNDSLRKLPLLSEDLVFFEPRFGADQQAPIEAALSMAEKIRLRGIEDPLTLLGHLYVLEGSTLGNQMHQPDIQATFQLPNNTGTHYYSS